MEGTYTYGYSLAKCKACNNKPENAFYIGLASASSDCPYECSQGLDSVEVNPLCLNALDVQVHKAGGAYSLLVIFTFFLAMVLILFVALIV